VLISSNGEEKGRGRRAHASQERVGIVRGFPLFSDPAGKKVFLIRQKKTPPRKIEKKTGFSTSRRSRNGTCPRSSAKRGRTTSSSALMLLEKKKNTYLLGKGGGKKKDGGLPARARKHHLPPCKVLLPNLRGQEKEKGRLRLLGKEVLSERKTESPARRAKRLSRSR